MRDATWADGTGYRPEARSSRARPPKPADFRLYSMEVTKCQRRLTPYL